MKLRLIFLLSFALIALAVTAGYSDSSETKKSTTYQLDQDDNSGIIFSAVAEKAEFVLQSPDLGSASPVNTLLAERSLEGYYIPVRAPPDAGLAKIRT